MNEKLFKMNNVHKAKKNYPIFISTEIELCYLHYSCQACISPTILIFGYIIVKKKYCNFYFILTQIKGSTTYTITYKCRKLTFLHYINEKLKMCYAQCHNVTFLKIFYNLYYLQATIFTHNFQYCNAFRHCTTYSLIFFIKIN